MSDLIDRQAVLATLDNMDKALDEERTVEKYKELLTECIKVLPSVENKGDLISRTEVINAIDEREDVNGNVNAEDIRTDICLIQSRSDKGEWIAQDIHNCHTNFKCSECGYIHSFMHLYGEPTADYTYCPNCGADMRGET